MTSFAQYCNVPLHTSNKLLVSITINQPVLDEHQLATQTRH